MAISATGQSSSASVVSPVDFSKVTGSSASIPTIDTVLLERIKATYKKHLNREAEQAGLQNAYNNISAGKISFQDWENSVINSGEAYNLNFGKANQDLKQLDTLRQKSMETGTDWKSTFSNIQNETTNIFKNYLDKYGQNATANKDFVKLQNLAKEKSSSTASQLGAMSWTKSNFNPFKRLIASKRQGV